LFLDDIDKDYVIIMLRYRVWWILINCLFA